MVAVSLDDRQVHSDALADFRVKTTLWIAIAGCVALAPLGLSNVIRGQELLGLSSVAIVAILLVVAWFSWKGRYSNLALLLFPPVVGALALSIEEQGVIGVMWAYPAVVCFYFMFEERWAWMANATTIAIVVPLSNSVLETAVALRAMATLVLISTFSILAVRVIGSQQRRLEKMAVTDPLTGLYNRSLLAETLQLAERRHIRFDEQTTLLALDVDLFKNINDTYGHYVGDEVLIGIAELLRQRLRGTDRIFRTGGEEFTIVLPGTAAEPGHHVAQLVRSAIAGENLIDSHPVTISVGVAVLRPEDDAASWLQRADRCLYEAKSGGRNRVVTDTPLTPAEFSSR